MAFATNKRVVCSLDYIFTIAGATRVVSTEPHDNLRMIIFQNPYHQRMSVIQDFSSLERRKFPRYYHQHNLLRLHRYSVVHFIGFSFPIKAPIFEGRCSILLSYWDIMLFFKDKVYYSRKINKSQQIFAHFLKEEMGEQITPHYFDKTNSLANPLISRPFRSKTDKLMMSSFKSTII